MPETLLPAGLVAVAVTLAALAGALLLDWVEERRRRSRLLQQLGSSDSALMPGTAGLLRGGRAPASPWIERVAARAPALAELEHAMQQAGMRWSVQSLLLLSAGLGAALGLALLLATGSGLLALAGAAVGLLLPAVVVRVRRRRRLLAFEAELPDAIDLLGRAIRAGHPLASGLQMVAEEAPETVGGEFRRAFEEHRYGVPFEDAIVAMADRVGLMDVRMLVTAILVQRTVGGNLAEVLDSLASVIRARFTLRGQIRTFTAQGRMSGFVLAALPIAAGLAIWALNRPYIRILFDTSLGRFMLVTAIVMQLMGYLWIRRIVRIEI